MTRLQRKTVMAFAGVVLAGAGLWVRGFASEPGGLGQVREITIVGDKYAFSPARIEVQKDDVVKVSFTSRDIAHSFTIDQYRIAKRAGAGQTVTFEFRADQPGPFVFYCNLTQDDRCRQMKGELVVR
jgi:heme/copper-type cytochrome/quinol oxidase subunit 2